MWCSHDTQAGVFFWFERSVSN